MARSDWRNHKPGSVEEYILDRLPLGFAFTASKSIGGERFLHDQARDHDGRFTGTGEGSGYLRFSASLESAFGSSIPASKWNEAKETIRQMTGGRILGRHLVEALEFYQAYEVNQMRGRTPEIAAREMGVSRQTFGEYRDKAIKMMQSLVFMAEAPIPIAG
jgi:hypothetical protein